MKKHNKELAEFFKTAPRSIITLSPKDFEAFTERLANPPAPNPALILAMEKARSRFKEDQE